jgi:SAM-dependent methyltransferase
MRLLRLSGPFAHDTGACYVARLRSIPVELSDDESNPRRSAAVLFEGERSIGVAHRVHSEIREFGRGRYSHWKDGLFFSTSDNSDPNSNGRHYALLLPEPASDGALGMMAEVVAMNDSLFMDAVRYNIGWTGGALYAGMHVFRLYRELLRECGMDPAGKTILEVGAGPRPGVALAFLLAGAERYLANDIQPINQTFSSHYASTLFAMLNVMGVRLVRALEDVCTVDSAGEGRLIAERYEALSRTPAERLGVADGSIDLVISASVFEHVTDPRSVVERSFQLLRPGGMAVHAIDLRDHANYFRPLDFLRLSEEEYVPRATENRWRASDFLAEFARAGFEIVFQRYRDEDLRLNPDGTVDLFALVSMQFPMLAPASDLEHVQARVTHNERSAYISRFREKSLKDLSVQLMWIGLRKPTG